MHHSIEHLIDIALIEDIGTGDITTESLIEDAREAKGLIIAKEQLVIAGLNVAKKVFEKLNPQIIFTPYFKDGDLVESNTTLCKASGNLKALLIGERTALNFLQKLSGVATNVHNYMKALKNKKIKLVDTRKTTPGWRILEKYAVRIGGGANHRFGLFDGVLIKDNHISVCGSITNAINIIRKKASHLLKIEVEVSTIAEVKEALKAGADIIMLDNMELPMIKEAAAVINKKALIEVSGGVKLSNLNLLDESYGIDIISSGALIHSARFMDISMDIY